MEDDAQIAPRKFAPVAVEMEAHGGDRVANQQQQTMRHVREDELRHEDAQPFEGTADFALKLAKPAGHGVR